MMTAYCYIHKIQKKTTDMKNCVTI